MNATTANTFHLRSRVRTYAKLNPRCRGDIDQVRGSGQKYVAAGEASGVVSADRATVGPALGEAESRGDRVVDADSTPGSAPNVTSVRLATFSAGQSVRGGPLIKETQTRPISCRRTTR